LTQTPFINMVEERWGYKLQYLNVFDANSKKALVG